MYSLMVHSHGELMSTPLVYFEWSHVKRCQTELWVRRIASLALLAAEVKNFKRQRRHQAIRSPYANTIAQMLANHFHASTEN